MKLGESHAVEVRHFNTKPYLTSDGWANIGHQAVCTTPNCRWESAKYGSVEQAEKRAQDHRDATVKQRKPKPSWMR